MRTTRMCEVLTAEVLANQPVKCSAARHDYMRIAGMSLVQACRALSCYLLNFVPDLLRMLSSHCRHDGSLHTQPSTSLLLSRKNSDSHSKGFSGS